MKEKVRVRFAPSPTGWLHIGGLRTALYNYLFARRMGGTFILRIEDTDRTRFLEGAEKDIIENLAWAGLAVDEGPEHGGGFGPYRQSERSDLYKKYAYKLLNDGHAYYAFDTPGELEHMRTENPNAKYDYTTRGNMKNSLTLSGDEVKKHLDSGEPYVIRLKVPEGEKVVFDDMIRGNVSFDTEQVDDQILIKSDGLPTYHLANVVDDHEMQISHVIRGEEWLSSVPKHLLIYKYLGWNPPVMAHLPLIMSPSGGKLSKRKAEKEGIPINVRDYISGNYEPEAVTNFLAFLGWSPGDDREIMSLNQLCDEFSLERVSKSGAVFNLEKLLWYNEHYLRNRPVKELLPKVKELCHEKGYPEKSDAFLEKAIALMIERVSTISGIAEEGWFLFDAPEEYDEKAVKKAWKENTTEYVQFYLSKLSGISDGEFKAARLKEELSRSVEELEIGFGKLMLPVRISVTGLGSGPDLFSIMELLGKEETENRIKHALRSLN